MSDQTASFPAPDLPPPDLDVIAVGSAIVDVLSEATDDFLVEQGLTKGSMGLIDTAGAETLYAAMGPGIEASGGSAANTAAGVASLGGAAGFIGKVRGDQLGSVFDHDMRATGVTTSLVVEPTLAHGGSDDPSTARCLILVTPDAQRTMNTYLGIAGQLTPDDVDAAFVARAKVTYVEGYLWDAESAKAAVEKAMEAARSAGRAVAFSLSDGFCVDRHREAFRDLIDRRIDLVFANESEICSLFEVDDFDAALKEAQARPGQTWMLTRSAQGSVVVAGGTTHVVAPEPVDRLVDTTGAGDLFAAGYLFGHVRGLAPDACARLGSIAAAEVISHVGARPQVPLAGLVAEHLS